MLRIKLNQLKKSFVQLLLSFYGLVFLKSEYHNIITAKLLFMQYLLSVRTHSEVVLKYFIIMFILYCILNGTLFLIFQCQIASESMCWCMCSTVQSNWAEPNHREQ